jgi:hypothetical protein
MSPDTTAYVRGVDDLTGIRREMDSRMVIDNKSIGSARTPDEALGAVDQSLRELTGNLLRVTIGTGNPSDIAAHALAYVGAIINLRDKFGGVPATNRIAESLAICRLDDSVLELEQNAQNLIAENLIIKGALEAAAARLLGEQLRESMGLYDIYGAVWMLVNLRSRR